MNVNYTVIYYHLVEIKSIVFSGDKSINSNAMRHTRIYVKGYKKFQNFFKVFKKY